MLTEWEWVVVGWGGVGLAKPIKNRPNHHSADPQTIDVI